MNATLSHPMHADPAAAFLAELQSGSYYRDSGPAWDALRRIGPAVRLPLAKGIQTYTTWATCAALARDPRLSSARAARYEQALPPAHRHEMKPFTEILQEMVIFLDPPRHTQVRNLLNRAFAPEVIARNSARIRQIFDQLLDEWIKTGDTEIMGSLVGRFPALVIADWLGLPRSDWARFLSWVEALGQLFSAPTSAIDMDVVRHSLAAVEENRAYLEEIVKGRTAGADDLVGFLTSMEEGQVLDLPQVVSQAMLILAGGHETTRNLIGSGLHWMLSKSCDYRELAGDDLAQRLAVDEILRLASPVQIVARLASEDFEFEGAQVKKGETVFLAIASANRDPAQFPEPERMDLRRRNNPHLSFGAGPHACLGLHLARIEAQIAFERLWARLPKLRLASPQPEWKRDLQFHGPVRLHVEYDRAA